jgi:dTDP-4-dehydrorhamnose 3,5-epimerase
MIDDCYTFIREHLEDNRGYFTELYRSLNFNNFDIKQINVSYSKKNTLRGIHRTPYAKVISCISGKIFDVCVDLRSNSKTYMLNKTAILSDKNYMSIYIPSYCGHGFLAIKDSIVLYYQSQEYNPIYDETYCYKNYNIEWPKQCQIKYISDKDNGACCNEMAQ